MSISFKKLSLIVCCLLSSSKIISQTSLVKDINEIPAGILEERYYNNIFISCNGYLFFMVENELGKEMWKTDGTTGGTSLVKDLNEGAADGAFSYQCVDGELFFSGDNGETGRELFKTDGSEAGTVLVKDHIPGVTGAHPSFFTSFKGLLYYFMNDGFSLKVWNSDGTPDGSEEVVILENPGSYINLFEVTSTDDHIYFVTYKSDFDTPLFQLWKSDGTAAGTSIILESEFYITKLVTVGQRCFFIQRTGGIGVHLMSTDGTVDGTKRVIDDEFINISELYNYNGKLVFNALGAAFMDDGLWISDGTSAGTHFLSGSSTKGIKIVNDLFYTIGFDNDLKKRFLSSSDGTLEGTQNLAELPGGSPYDISLYGQIPMVGDKFIVPMFDENLGEEAGVTDGTDEGTYFLKDIKEGSLSSSPRSWAELNGSVYFIADDGVHGSEIWKTDGTPEGTDLLVDVKPGTNSSNPSQFQEINNNLLFIAKENNSGKKVWKTSALDESALKLIDVEGPTHYLGRTDTDVYYENNLKIYKTDGNNNATIVKDLSSEIFGFGYLYDANYTLGEKLIYYFNTYNTTGGELWVTDGTEDGTGILKNINPGSASSILYFDGTGLNERYLFAADDGIHGNELWTTDGTEAGTTIIKDLYAGAVASNPRNFTSFGDQVFFSAEEDQKGHRLWKTDGTEEGTTAVKALIDETTGSNVPFIAKAGDNLIVAVNDEVDGSVLWKSDGTEDGTMIVKEGLSGISQHHITIGGITYFTASEETIGSELWVADGTYGGTHPIDITQGVAGSSPSNFINVEGLVYFKANNQLWRSNGTAEYTELVADVEPINMVYFDGYIYFSMVTEEFGVELFKIPFSKYDQSITFEPIPVKVLGDEAFQTTANSSSGLPVTFTANSLNIKLEESMVSMHQAGSVDIEARQEGNSLFNAATPVIQTFCINPSQPSISVAEGNGLIELVSSSEAGNQWFRNGFLLEDKSDQRLVVDESGTYSVQVQIGDCSSSLSTEESIIITSVIENNEKGIALFPNPASDKLYIQTNGSQPASLIEILDMTGKSYGQFVVEDPTSQISLDHLLAGVYVVKIHFRKSVTLRKLVKE